MKIKTVSVIDINTVTGDRLELMEMYNSETSLSVVKLSFTDIKQSRNGTKKCAVQTV